MADSGKRKRFIIDIFYWAIILALIFLVFKYLLNLVMPFFLALIFSALMRPLIKLLNRKCHIQYNLAAVIAMVLFFGIVCVLIIVIAAKLVSVASDYILRIPALYTDTIEPGLLSLVDDIEGLATRFDISVVEMVDEALPQIISTIGSAVTSFSTTAVSKLAGFATKLPRFMLSWVICVIATVFMTFGFEKITAFVSRQLPQKALTMAVRIKDSFVKIIFQYGRSYALILLITFVEIAVGLLIIGFKNWWLIAICIAVFDLFPIVGSGMVLLPWAVITLIQGHIGSGIGLLILYIVVVVARQVIEPRIIGRHVGLPPLVTLMAMFVGTKLFGGIGLFGLPILMAILVNLNDTGVISIFKLSGPSKGTLETPSSPPPDTPAT